LLKQFDFDLILKHLARDKHLWRRVFGVKRLNAAHVIFPFKLKHGIKLISEEKFMDAAVFYTKVTAETNSTLLALACRSMQDDYSAMTDIDLLLKDIATLITSSHPAIVLFSLSVIMNLKAKTGAKDHDAHSSYSKQSYGYGLLFISMQSLYPELEGWKSIITRMISKLNDSIWTAKIPLSLESPSQKRWRIEKETNFTVNPALDAFMLMIGLESVKVCMSTSMINSKDMFLNIFDSVCIDLRRNMSIHDKRLNVCFTGNPFNE